MIESTTDDKKIFLVISENSTYLKSVSAQIKSHQPKASIFEASEMHEALFKFRNAVPHVLVIDLNISKYSAIQVVTDLLKSDNNQFSVIFTSKVPDTELFVDQVVSGQVQFVKEYTDKTIFSESISKAIRRLQSDKKSDFTLRQIKANDVLFSEGDVGDCMFLVKSGELTAWKMKNNQRIDLGHIGPGEFVGEMAHLNQEPRSANVSALKDTDLIVIPFGSLDMILFSKPSWSKALFMTLSKRLKITSEKLST